MVKYAQTDHALENELGLHHSNRIISHELREALTETLLPKAANPTKNYLYCTLWTAISKQYRVMVGDLCIVDEPNENGEIEIGYGTYERYQGLGYMTEIVAGLIEWAKNQHAVKTIKATTEKANIPSCRVLQKNQFIIVQETETQLLWKYSFV